MGRMVMRPSEREIASQPESRGTDISFITRVRLIQRGIQVYKSAGFCIGHPLLERFRDPGVIVFHDEFGDLCTFAGWKGFELLDNFSGPHDDQNTLPRYLPQSRYSLTLRLSTLNAQLSTISSQTEYLQFPGCILPLPDFLGS